jgi:4-amino-4-deoxy-L-arabinose transferase
VALAGFLPWTPFYLLSLFCSKASDPLSKPARAAFVGWIVIPFILLSLSGSKLLTYLLPLFPGVAIWAAHGLQTYRGKRGLLTASLFQSILLASLACGIGTILCFPQVLPDELDLDTAALITASGALVFATGFAILLRRGVSEIRVVGLSIWIIAAWLAITIQIPHLNPVLLMQASLQPLAKRIQSEPESANARIIVAGTRGHGLKFYLGRVLGGTTNQADIVLPLNEAQSKRLYAGVPEAQAAAVAMNEATFLVTRDREAPHIPSENWEFLQAEGAFNLYKLRVKK